MQFCFQTVRPLEQNCFHHSCDISNLLIHWEVVYAIDMPITCQFELVKCIVHVAVCEWKKKEKKEKKRKKKGACYLFCFGVVVRSLNKVSLFFVAAVGLSIVGGRSLSFQLLFLCWNSRELPGTPNSCVEFYVCILVLLSSNTKHQ